MIVQSDGKIPPSSPSPASPAPIQTVCGNCGAEEFLLLHNVRHRMKYRRLCTTCVLRLHSQLFCPSCFLLYSSPPSCGVTCSVCHSCSHTECVGADHVNPYVCPLCVNPNSPIFLPKKMKDLISENPEAANGTNDGTSGEYRVIDQRNAKVLLAAAKISAESMCRAAMAARAEAERRAKEAAFTRKRARVALELVACVIAQKKMRKKNSDGARTGVGNGCMIRNSGNGSNGSVGSLNAAAMRVNVAKAAGSGVSDAVRRDSSSDLPAALNAVELREREKISGESKSGDVGSVQSLNVAVPMDIEANGRLEMSAVHEAEETVNIGHPVVFPRDNNQPVELNDNVSGR